MGHIQQQQVLHRRTSTIYTTDTATFVLFNLAVGCRFHASTITQKKKRSPLEIYEAE